CFGLGLARGQLELDDFLASLLEHVGAAFEEEHSEDVLLEFGGIHLSAQDVGGFEEVAFKLGQGKGHGGPVDDSAPGAAEGDDKAGLRWVHMLYVGGGLSRIGRPDHPGWRCPTVGAAGTGG